LEDTGLAKGRELSKHSENKWVILALLALAQFMIVLDLSIVNVALPSIARNLHFAPSALQWVVTAYSITFGGFVLLGGRAADLFGRRRLFIGAVSVFLLASLSCGLAQSSTMLIITRAIQGLAAAIMSPAALSIVLTEFSEGKERNTALGVWSSVAAGGAAFGVLLGGILTQYVGWRWNFFINVPVGILVVLASLRLLPRHEGEENKKTTLDATGAVSATAGLMALVYGLSKAPADGWGSHTVIGFLIAAVVLLVAFVINEARVRQPLMPLSIFKIRNVSGGNIAALVIASTLFSQFFFISLYVQTVLGFGPAKSGLCFLPVTFIIAVTSILVSRSVGKIGYKWFLTAGPLALAVGFFMLRNIPVHGTYWGNVFPGLAINAFGMGLSFISMTLAATTGIPKHFSGLASGVLNTSQQVGGAIGLAVLSAVSVSAMKTYLKSGHGALSSQVNGYHHAFYVAIGLAIAASLVAFLVVKNHKVNPDAAIGA
jgi:EmrB/QacA subfamily drug resistance transporter